MSDALEKVHIQKTRQVPRRQRSIYQVHYCLPRHDVDMARPLVLPTDPAEVQAYDQQVAGHNKTVDTKYLGLLQCTNGTILKPIIKESQKRELDFYDRINSSNEPDLVELRQYIPKFYGCRKFTYNSYEQDYIVLEQLTDRMLEPCIMDVKIGKRTWDPLATADKIKAEQSKYAASRREFAFCIPGYQLYKLSTGKLYRYNKEHGKKLHGHMVRDAVRNYLNGGGGRLCRSLLLQLLAAVWKVQQWAARQTALRLYSASLLLVYDAARLRDCCGNTDPLLPSRPKCQPASLLRRRHTISTHTPASFSGQLTSRGPHYRKLQSVPLSPMWQSQVAFLPPRPTASSPWTDAFERLKHNHSFDHNYEDKLSTIKMNYRAILDKLTSDTPNPNPWVSVKIIDFAHAFFQDEDSNEIDENFKEGIDSFVAILEIFLKETDDQVY